MINNLNIERRLLINDLKKDYYFFYDVINTIINSTYISDENKNLLKYYKKIIKEKIIYKR